jgi:hypothetical protein
MPPSRHQGDRYDEAQRFEHGERIDDLLVGYVAVLVSGPLAHEEEPLP